MGRKTGNARAKGGMKRRKRGLSFASPRFRRFARRPAAARETPYVGADRIKFEGYALSGNRTPVSRALRKRRMAQPLYIGNAEPEEPISSPPPGGGACAAGEKQQSQQKKGNEERRAGRSAPRRRKTALGAWREQKKDRQARGGGKSGKPCGPNRASAPGRRAARGGRRPGRRLKRECSGRLR